MAPVPPRDPADAGADVPVRGRRHRHRPASDLRRTVCDDARRTAQPDADGGDADVRPGLPLVADGLRGLGGIRALPHRRRGHAAATETAGAPMSRTLSGIVSGTGNVTTRRVQSFFLHSALIAGALVTLFPLLSRLARSLLTSGEATSLPPHLIPHSPTFAQYRELFVR